MPKRPPKGQQLDTISREGDIFQSSFDLRKQDQFVTSLGVQFIHYKALPSPIGLKDKGDYRRSDGIDTISSNGFIYKKAGCFTATLVGNSGRKKPSDGGFLDESMARLIMPRFYDKGQEVAGGSRIYLSPGDRVYIADPNADVLVPNFQRMDYEPDQDNRPMFPICKMEYIEDSQGRTFQEGVDFTITPCGDIRWIPGGSNPGIDPDTKRGRIYSVRYLYKAFWYVIQIPSEVRITNITNGDVRSPERMASHAVIQREYVYQNQINSKMSNLKPEEKRRVREEPTESIAPNSTQIRVNMSDIGDGDGQ
jgi:hypothetical protein